MSRVRSAFALTGFVAVLPPLFWWLQSGYGVPLSGLDGTGAYRGLLIGAGSVALTALLIGVLVLVVLLRRRMARPSIRA
ncbi:MAG: hypothetical protein WB461_12195 [Aeromicrobium sp.]